MDETTHVMEAHVSNLDLDMHSVVVIRWEFKRSDPYAVAMTAFTDGGEVEWLFARQIIIDALAETETDPVTGHGDVMMSADADDVVLYLSSPEGNAALIFKRDAMEIFLSETYSIIPAQGEADALGTDLDEFLSDILGYTPTVTVDDSPLKGETKEITIDGKTYTVPEDSPEDLAPWEAELLDSLYSQEVDSDDDTATEE